jgi:hypothetical protein
MCNLHKWKETIFSSILNHQLQLNKLVFLLDFHWNEGNDNHQYKTNNFFEKNDKNKKKVEKKLVLLSSVTMIAIVRAWAHDVHGVGYGSCDINNRAWQ